MDLSRSVTESRGAGRTGRCGPSAAWRAARACALLSLALMSVAAVGADDELPPGRFAFRAYGAEQGLQNLVVGAVVQDSAGFLWIGTEDGLYRFDGHRFTRFGVEHRLPTSSIAALLPEPAGTLWIGTFSGLAWGGGDRFQAAPVATIPRGHINGLAVDGAGGLWAAMQMGLYHRVAGGSFDCEVGWPDGEATAVVADRHGGKLYAAHGTRVGQLDRGGSWSFEETGFDASERIDALAVDGAGRLWVAGVRHLLSKGSSHRSFRDESSAVGQIATLPSRGILEVDRSGDLWVSTDSGLLHRRAGKWLRLGATEGLPGGRASGLFHDREGSAWVWQVGQGLYRLLGRRLWESWTRQEGLPGDIVWSVLRDCSGRFWVGTSHGLVRATADGWVPIAGTEEFAVRRIAEAGDGTLWLGAQPTAVLRLHPDTGRLERFDQSDGVAGRMILDLRVGHAGDIWVATAGAGVLHRSSSSSRFEPVAVPLDPDVLKVYFAVEDSQRRLWVGGIGGLAVRERGEWRRFTRADGLLSDDVTQFTERVPGEFWIAYTESIGITQFQLEGGGMRVVEHRDARSGLTAARPYFLATDSFGRLWLGTGSGVDVINGRDVQHFDRDNGLVGDDCAQLAFWADSDGDVFVGTSSGLSRFRGSRNLTPTTAPSTALVRVLFSAHQVSLGDALPLRSPRSRNSLEALFAGMSFAAEGLLEYEVRLAGLEAGWRRSNDRSALYPALPPGEYRFEARSRVRGGEWGPPAGFDFEILPAWWETVPVRVVEWILAALLVFAGAKLRFRQLRRRQEHLQDLVTARTAELGTVNERLNRANKELNHLSTTDALTGLANRRAFNQALDYEWRRACRNPGPLSLIVLDIDYFKQFNDTHSHSSNDECLARVGSLLGDVCRRPGDLVARYGGEEFAIVLPGATVEGAWAIAEAVRQQVQELALPHTGSAISEHLTVSFGVASTVPVPSENPDLLFLMADKALYKAKSNGRDRVEMAECWWSGAGAASGERRARLEFPGSNLVAVQTQ